MNRPLKTMRAMRAAALSRERVLTVNGLMCITQLNARSRSRIYLRARASRNGTEGDSHTLPENGASIPAIYTTQSLMHGVMKMRL